MAIPTNMAIFLEISKLLKLLMKLEKVVNFCFEYTYQIKNKIILLVNSKGALFPISKGLISISIDSKLVISNAGNITKVRLSKTINNAKIST